jgi:phosphoribosylformylglycinamidine cyclo-ligase
MASSGLHSNGYSLVRMVLDRAGLSLDACLPGLARPLGEELLEPTRIYARDCLALARQCDVRAYAHITGGGLAANLSRVLPPGTAAILDRATWRPPAVFGLLAEYGQIPPAEMERVFNMGIGMAAIIAPESVTSALTLLAAQGVPAWPLGEVTSSQSPPSAHLTGTHPA